MLQMPRAHVAVYHCCWLPDEGHTTLRTVEAAGTCSLLLQHHWGVGAALGWVVPLSPILNSDECLQQYTAMYCCVIFCRHTTSLFHISCEKGLAHSVLV